MRKSRVDRATSFDTIEFATLHLNAFRGVNRADAWNRLTGKSLALSNEKERQRESRARFPRNECPFLSAHIPRANSCRDVPRDPTWHCSRVRLLGSSWPVLSEQPLQPLSRQYLSWHFSRGRPRRDARRIPDFFVRPNLSESSDRRNTSFQVFPLFFFPPPPSSSSFHRISPFCASFIFSLSFLLSHSYLRVGILVISRAI